MKEHPSVATGALIVIDLQTGMFTDAQPPIHNADVLVTRVRAMLDWARRTGRKVAFIRHDGESDDPLAPGEPGWPIWPPLGKPRMSRFSLRASTMRLASRSSSTG